MKKIDKRGELEKEPFSYRATKDGLVFLEFHGTTVKTIAGEHAKKFLKKTSALEGLALQLVLAKLTGNFKHGNEK
jgi:hypothetical protein